MVVGIDELIKCVQENRLKNWEVRTQVGESNTTQMRTFENQTADEKIELLRSVMSNNYGKFHLIGYDTPSQAKGRIDIEFLIRQEGTGDLPAQRAIAGVPQDIAGYRKESEVQQMIENIKLQNEINGLKTKLDTIEKEKKELESPMNDFVRNLAPIVGAVATNLLKGKAPTAIGELGAEGEGEEHDQTTEEEELNDSINEALSRWSAVDRDCFTLLGKIADLAENDPQTYNMAKTMLMSR